MASEMKDKIRAGTPEEICQLFKRYMQEGDLESLLSLYDTDVVFVSESGEMRDRQQLKDELAPLVATHTVFDFNIIKVIQADNVALMHTQWIISSSQSRSLYAIEVARRQPDGSWRWLIGDPFTVSNNWIN